MGLLADILLLFAHLSLLPELDADELLHYQAIQGRQLLNLLLDALVLDLEGICRLDCLQDDVTLVQFDLSHHLLDQDDVVIHGILPLAIYVELNQRKPKEQEPLLLLQVLDDLVLQIHRLQPLLVQLGLVGGLLSCCLGLLK